MPPLWRNNRARKYAPSSDSGFLHGSRHAIRDLCCRPGYL